MVAERRLVQWYRNFGRHELPWRVVRDPWRVLMAEVLLQQTQVSRVLPLWQEFSTRYSTPERLAAAGLGDLLSRWDRLGYPRRARALHEAAVRISAEGWPADLETLRGVGTYTAAAVRIQAHNSDEIALDTNIRRALHRYIGPGTRTPLAAARQMTAPLEPRDRFWALMDLGASICLPNPACPRCPVRRSCATRGRLSSEQPRIAARYEGSFRQERGEILRAVRSGPVQAAAFRPAAVESLCTEGLVRRCGELLTLPE